MDLSGIHTDEVRSWKYYGGAGWRKAIERARVGALHDPLGGYQTRGILRDADDIKRKIWKRVPEALGVGADRRSC